MKRFILIVFSLMACADDEVVNTPPELTWTYFTTSDGLPSNFISALYEDNLGRIWIGTEKGVSVFDGTNFKNYNMTNGLVDNSVYSITQAGNGDIWLGTDNGVSVFRNNQWYYYSTLNGITILSLITDSFNVIWLGTVSYGIVKFDGATFRQSLDNTCSACNDINNLFEDEGRQVWIGSDGDIKVYVSGSYRSFTTKDGVVGKSTSVITQDSWGNIWMGTSDDLRVNRYRNGKFEPISLSNNTASYNWVLGMQADRFGQLWIGTVSNGLIVFDGAIARKQFSGTPGKSVTAMMTDHNDDIWVGTSSNGIGKFTPLRMQ